MPTYEYLCPEGHEFELFQKMSDKPRAKCPSCGRIAARKISGGAGLVFKGSGFYITDYGKDGKGPRKAADKAETPTKSDQSGTTESKPEQPATPKAETKPAKEGKSSKKAPKSE
jgi:putative FmdB family regulatory protein